MFFSNKIWAVIPARSGSKGLKNKNVLNFKGHPLLTWTLSALKENKISNKVVYDIKDNFSDEILSIKLEKKIIYKENIILQSLYKAANEENIPPNTIIEFARIYGFQVDFQRDIRKKDKFQLMYELYLNDKKEIVETGEILFANLKLSGQDNSLYYFDSEGSEGHYDKNGKSAFFTLFPFLS